MLNTPPLPRQQGAILFISLIILLIMTVVAIGSTRVSTTGQRISFNYQMKNNTFQAADSGLSVAQETLLKTPDVNEIEDDLTIANPPLGQAITTRYKVSKTHILQGSSLSTDTPKMGHYKMTSDSEISTLNIRSTLEAGYLKPEFPY